MVLGLVALILASRPDASPSAAVNGTAEVLVEKITLLGIEFPPNDGSASRVTAEDAKARARANAGSWLETQLTVADDSVAEPPSELRSYLEDRRGAIESIVTALEKEPPVWRGGGQLPSPELLPSSQLQRVLLAACLVQVRAGHTAEAERLLESSWSLARPVAESPLLFHQMLSWQTARFQAGVLRKLRTTPPAWIDRLADDRVWAMMLAAYQAESAPRHELLDELSRGNRDWKELFERVPESVRDVLRKLGPCDSAHLDEDGLWRWVERDLSISSSEQTSAIRRNYRELFLPMLANPVRRAAQLAVDQELTLEILRLRSAKEQNPRGRWPEEFPNPVSTVCPSAGYAYRSDGNGMEIRFEGARLDPDASFRLPLEFHGAGGAAPPLTPTPSGGMIPPR